MSSEAGDGASLYGMAAHHEAVRRPSGAGLHAPPAGVRGGAFVPWHKQQDVLRATRSKTATFVEAGSRYTDLVQAHRQLLQTDNNVEPVMGAVHLVRPASNFHEKHFMVDVEGDINEGRRKLIQKGRRGPFAESSGRSTVMDSSAHVKYRNRRGVMEITVRRGATEYEVQLVISKLRSHNFGADAYLTLIKGKKKYRLGRLREFSLDRLRQLVQECLMSYSSCGLEITGVAGDGALYKPGTHTEVFKNRVKRGVGLFR